MGHRKTVIYILTILLAAAALFFGLQQTEEAPPFYFLAETDAGNEVIHFWQGDDGECYVFLPSYVNLSKLTLHTTATLQLDDLELGYGADCAAVMLGRRYSLSGGAGMPDNLTFLQSENLPAMYIDTVSGNMEQIHEEKGIEEPGELRLYTPEGTVDYRGRLESIKARGNSSFWQPKKPYSLKLPANADLLGMGAAQRWILLANTSDQTHLKNKLVYDFASEVGLPYAPESQWVDLYLNGEYAGLYLLSERNEMAPQRIDIAGEDAFLISKEQPEYLFHKQVPYFVTEAGAAVRIHAAKMEAGTVADICQSMENAILAEDGVDPVTGKHWSQLIDLDSWARKYLVEEIFGGVDAGVSSQFFYYRDGRIFAGPVWDYDGAMGTPLYLGWTMVKQGPEVFYAHRDHVSPWNRALYYDDAFYTAVKKLYKTEFAGPLQTLIEEKIPQSAAWIRQAASLNQIRWNYGDAFEHARKTQTYMAERQAFLNRVWTEDSDYLEVVVDFGQDPYVFDYVLFPGDILPELPSEPGREWYDANTGQSVDFTEPIYESTRIYLKTAEREAQTVAEEIAEPERTIGLVDLLRGAFVAMLAGVLLLLIFTDIHRRKE